MLWQILSLPIQILCLCPSGVWLLRLKKTYVFYLLSFKFATEHKSWILAHSFPAAISSACPIWPKINRQVTVQRGLSGTKIQHKWKVSVQTRNVQSKKSIGWYQRLPLPHWSGIHSSHFHSVLLHLISISSLVLCLNVTSFEKLSPALFTPIPIPKLGEVFILCVHRQNSRWPPVTLSHI